MTTYIYEDELYHHGVKGMKWGVRRYQNKDGTRTPKGKEHRKLSTKAKVIGVAGATAALAIGVGAAVTVAYFRKNPTEAYVSAYLVQQALKGAGKKAAASLSSLPGKAWSVSKNAAKRSATAAVDAAVLATGSIIVNRIVSRYSYDVYDTQADKDRKAVLSKATKAGLDAFTRSMTVQEVKKAVRNDDESSMKKAVGEPSNKRIDRQSKEWASLFNDENGNPRSKEEKQTIRSMADKGYDSEQIAKYLKTLRHSALGSELVEMYLGEFYE